MIKNKIEKNSIGVSVLGDEFGIKICQNQITNNCFGVKLGIGSQAEVSRNYICDNETGF